MCIKGRLRKEGDLANIHRITTPLCKAERGQGDEAKEEEIAIGTQ